jgi:hypothetical protein
MCFKKMVIVLFVLVVLFGCAKSEKKAASPVSPTSTTSVPTTPGTVKEYIAVKYSDGGIWENGINKRDGNQFLISIPTGTPTPVNYGDKLKFAATGDAVVTNFSRMEKPGFSAIFIVVNKKIDPVGDGYPHPIVFLNAR